MRCVDREQLTKLKQPWLGESVKETQVTSLTEHHFHSISCLFLLTFSISGPCRTASIVTLTLHLLPQIMHPQPYPPQESYTKSPTIQDSADKIMALLEQERSLERQLTSDASKTYYRALLEDCQSRSRVFEGNQAMQITQCQKELAQTRIDFDDLRSRKSADEAMLQSLVIQNQALQNECDSMRQQMTEIQNFAYMSGAEACHAATASDLKKFGIVYWGPNSLSFEEPWLRLWNQYVTEDPQDKMSSDHRVTHKEMGILLENFMDQLRKDKNNLQTLEQQLSVLRDERAFRSHMANDKHLKVTPSETKAETARPTSQIYENQPAFIKTEPGLDFSSL